MREPSESKDRIVQVIKMIAGSEKEVESLENENEKLYGSLDNQHYLDRPDYQERQCDAVLSRGKEHETNLWNVR